MRGLNVKEMKSRIDPRRLIRRRKDPIARAVAAQSQSQQASQQQQQQKSSGGNCAAEVMELLNCMKANDFDDCKCTREKGILTECTRLMVCVVHVCVYGWTHTLDIKHTATKFAVRTSGLCVVVFGVSFGLCRSCMCDFRLPGGGVCSVHFSFLVFLVLCAFFLGGCRVRHLVGRPTPSCTSCSDWVQRGHRVEKSSFFSPWFPSTTCASFSVVTWCVV